MVALEDASPAADFGSLSAFLGVGVPVGDGGARLKAPVPLPTSAASTGRGEKDGTLNKKVAFRMLKQLGCEVRTDEDGEVRYVQVGIKTQPVLFKMLVELGHVPRRGEDGEFLVQVAEQRPRKPEEIVASLSAPRKPPRAPRQETEDEGYPTVGRPRLKPEDAQMLVSRLYKVPKRPPAEVTKTEVAKPRRTAAEQRAYLDRLVKPRTEELAPELDEVMVEAGRRLLKNGITWPSFSSPSEKERSAPKKRTRLAQAGLAICEPKATTPNGESLSRSSRPSSAGAGAHLASDEDAADSPPSPLQIVAHSATQSALQSALQQSGHSTPSARPDEDPSDDELEPETQAPAQDEVREPQEPGLPEEESTGAWLERLLGPAKFPGRERRSGKEQRERLEELAKPRQVKEPEPLNLPSKPRSPRSQKEACKRLAQPRKPKAEATAEPAQQAPDGQEAGEDAEDGMEGDEADPAPVKIIPSLLAQCPSRLERIDEEAKESRSQLRRGSPHGRARSQGATRGRRAPYAVPVVPKHLVDGRPKRRLSDRGPGPDRGLGPDRDEAGEAEEELSPEDMAKLASLLAGEVGEESEAMLDNIDALYTQLMGAARVSPDIEDPEVGRQVLPGFEPDLELQAPLEEGPAEPAPSGPCPSPEPVGEDLLADIDRLYCEMLDGKGLQEQEELPEAPEAPRPPPPPRPEPEAETALAPDPAPAPQPPEEAAEEAPGAEALEELPALLEELLWSAILLTRGAAGHKLEPGSAEARLLQLLPPARLAQAASVAALPGSLLQRLATELPKVRAAMEPGDDGPIAPKDGSLLRAVREARDRLLSSAAEGTTSRPSSGRSRHSGASSKRLRSKPRRSSMSYWTEESLDALEAPKRMSAAPAGRGKVTATQGLFGRD